MASDNSGRTWNRRQLLTSTCLSASTLPLFGSAAAAKPKSNRNRGKGKEKCKTKVIDETDSYKLTQVICRGDVRFFYADKEENKVEEVLVSEGEMAQVRSNPQSAVDQFEVNSIVESFNAFKMKIANCHLPVYDNDYLLGCGIKLESDINSYSVTYLGGALCAIPQIGTWLRLLFGGSCSVAAEALKDGYEGKLVGVAIWDDHSHYYVPVTKYGHILVGTQYSLLERLGIIDDRDPDTILVTTNEKKTFPATHTSVDLLE